MTDDDKTPGPSAVPGAMDTGIPIGKAEFRRAVADYLDRMEHAAALTAEDYLTMVRIWNTIEFRRLADEDDLYRRYSQMFFPGFVERASQSLHAQPTKGMALYSREHDVFLGGKPHANSQYRLNSDP